MNFKLLQEACCAATHLRSAAWPDLLPALLNSLGLPFPLKWDHTFTSIKLQWSMIWLEQLAEKLPTLQFIAFPRNDQCHLPGVSAKRGMLQLWFPGFIFFSKGLIKGLWWDSQADTALIYDEVIISVLDHQLYISNSARKNWLWSYSCISKPSWSMKRGREELQKSLH